MSTSAVFKNTKVWRTAQIKNGVATFGGVWRYGEPSIEGQWQVGEGWRKQSWDRNVVIEVREVAYTRLFSVEFRGSSLYARSKDFRTAKSRKSSKYYFAANGYEYEGEVAYSETLYEEHA